MADDDLRRAVSDELLSDPEIGVDADIGVRVAQGEVKLSGAVARYSDKRAAVNAARRVRGVRSVRDEIEVVARADADLRSDVLAELELGHIPATVHAEVRQGMVTLTGTVERQHQHDAAAFIAKVVPGVVGVENRIQVRGRSRNGGYVEDSTPAEVGRIGDLDVAGVAASTDESRRELGAQLAAAARRIEQIRSASEAAGNVVQFRLERYLEALESDAIDAHGRLATISDVRSYDWKVLQQEIVALESGVAVAEAKLDAARAAERDDPRGEIGAEVRAMEVEARGIRALFDRTFGAKGRADDSDRP